MKYNFMIPYRDMQGYLDIISSKLPSYLDEQGIDYNIIIVEQEDGKMFNLGKLINIAFDLYKKGETGYEYSKDDVLIWYPVDCAPVDINFDMKGSESVVYCADDPWYGKAVSYYNWAFEKVNGFGNEYWGHGREDDDMFVRLGACNVKVERRECNLSFIPHAPRDTSHRAHSSDKLLLKMQRLHNYMDSGLNNLEYSILDRTTINGIDKIRVSL